MTVTALVPILVSVKDIETIDAQLSDNDNVPAYIRDQLSMYKDNAHVYGWDVIGYSRHQGTWRHVFTWNSSAISGLSLALKENPKWGSKEEFSHFTILPLVPAVITCTMENDNG